MFCSFAAKLNLRISHFSGHVSTWSKWPSPFSNSTENKKETLNNIRLDSYINKNTNTIKSDLEKNKINVIVIGDGDKVINQYPKANTTVNKLDKVFLITNSNNNVIPDFNLYSKSEILVLCSFLDIKVKISGDGYAYEQSIKKGTKIDKNKTLEIKLRQKK